MILSALEGKQGIVLDVRGRKAILYKTFGGSHIKIAFE